MLMFSYLGKEGKRSPNRGREERTGLKTGGWEGGCVQKEGLRRARWTPDVADTQEHLSVGCSRALAVGGAGRP